MRRPSIYSQRQQGVDVKMTPMIDVVFLLLVFFVWTASFQIIEQVLPSSISSSSTAGSTPVDTPPPEEIDFEQIVIRVLWQGGQAAWTINGQPVKSLAAVRSRLATIAEIKQDAPVILDPDPAAPLGHVIDLYDAARLENFQRVQFAASEVP
jgi:biopolymer transport protein ExbD